VDELVYATIVHFVVKVEQEIAKACHLLKPSSQLAIQDCQFDQDFKTVGIILWSSTFLAGHNVITDVNGGFTGDNQQVFGALRIAKVAQKLCLGQVTQLSKLMFSRGNRTK